MLRLILKSMRPEQWVKNAFLLAPLIFSRNLTSLSHVAWAIMATAIFCLVSGGMYILNDLCDQESDRLHPAKANRPIASGRLSIANARWAFVCLMVLGISLGLLINLPFLATLLAYIALNLGYSFYLKKVAFLDVISIGLGFLLRVLAGALAIEVPVSAWLFICTFLLSLYLALGKREHELLTLGPGQNTRKVLEDYNLGHIKVAMVAVAAITAICYSTYSFDPRTAQHVGTRGLPLTIPFIVLGLVRFYVLAQRSKVVSSPTEQLVKDPLFVTNMLAWGAVVVTLIYIG